jgi:hypothetical protein
LRKVENRKGTDGDINPLYGGGEDFGGCLASSAHVMSSGISSVTATELIKFDPKDWLQWYISINHYFRRTVEIRGVPLDWVHRDNEIINPVIYREAFSMKVELLKATVLMNCPQSRYTTRSSQQILDTSAWSHSKKFEALHDS